MPGTAYIDMRDHDVEKLAAPVERALTYGDIAGRSAAWLVNRALGRMKKENDPMNIALHIAEITNGFLVSASNGFGAYSSESLGGTSTFYATIEEVKAALPLHTDAAITAAKECEAQYSSNLKSLRDTVEAKYAGEPLRDRADELWNGADETPSASEETLASPGFLYGDERVEDGKPEPAFTIGSHADPRTGDTFDEADKQH